MPASAFFFELCSLFWPAGLVLLKSAGSGIRGAAGISGSAGRPEITSHGSGVAACAPRSRGCSIGSVTASGSVGRTVGIDNCDAVSARCNAASSGRHAVSACHAVSRGISRIGTGAGNRVSGRNSGSGIAAAGWGRINTSGRAAVDGGCFILADAILVKGVVDVVDGVGTVGNHFSVGWIQIVIFPVHLQPSRNHVP